jgi:glycosyltransferase involved in cell wall biosynthesis
VTARLTIGLPVRNGGDQLQKALDSLLGQTFSDLELVISDNESDDNTAEVCAAAARADPRIRYIRQPKNLGNPGNFRFTLFEATTPYFMWAAHDDIWSPTFAENNIALLDANPRAVASVSHVELTYPDGPSVVTKDTAPIVADTAVERVRRYFWDVADSSRFYSVFRTDVLQRAFPPDIGVFGWDWIVCALTLVEGDHLETPEVLLRREGQPFGHYFRTLLRLHASGIDRYVPFRQFSRRLKQHLPPDVWAAIRWQILRYNVAQCANLLRYRAPALAGPIRAAAKLRRAVAGASPVRSSIRTG